MKTFSEILKYERKAQGYTQEQFSQMLGINRGTYNKYELAEKGREPKIEMLIKIAKLLDVSVDYLLGLED